MYKSRHLRRIAYFQIIHFLFKFFQCRHRNRIICICHLIAARRCQLVAAVFRNLCLAVVAGAAAVRIDIIIM